MNSKSVTDDRSERILAKRRKIGGCDSESSSSSSSSSRLIPYELISMILVLLPADVLYNVMRYVCKGWFNIIQSPDFIYSHIEKSTSGLLMRETYCVVRRKRFSIDGCGIKLKELNFKCISKIIASCNGLVFVVDSPGARDMTEGRCCYVINLVTKQLLPLPLIPYPIDTTQWYFGYACASRIYKILHPQKDNYILLLSVGVDKAWRKIDITHLSFEAQCILSNYQRGVVIRGFVYIVRFDGISFNPIVVCFEMETETFTEIRLPLDCLDTCYIPLKRGDCLCLWERVGTLSYEFWLMNNPENGQWERLYVDLTGERRVIEQLINCGSYNSCYIKNIFPFGWLRNGELLVLVSPRKIIFFYNIITGEIHQHEDFKNNPRYECSYTCFDHIDTLVPINNLSLVVPPRETFICRHKLYSKQKMRANFDVEAEETRWLTKKPDKGKGKGKRHRKVKRLLI